MEKEVLEKHLGQEKAEEILKLTKAYDAYILKFRKKINKLIEPVDLEVKIYTQFKKKEAVNGTV